MSSKKSFITAVVIYAAFLVAFVGGSIGVANGKKHNYQHRDEITRAGYEPAPEINTYQISPALAWKATNDGAAGVFKVIGYVIVLVLGVFVWLFATDRVYLEKDKFNKSLFVILVLAGACIFAAYASTYVSNWVSVTPDQHKAIQDDVNVLVEIFKAKELIK